MREERRVREVELIEKRAHAYARGLAKAMAERGIAGDARRAREAVLLRWPMMPAGVVSMVVTALTED